MPAKWSVDTARTSVDLPIKSRQQLAELMSDIDESLRDCLIICIAERWQRECGEPQRDSFAELEARVAALERIAAEGYDRWFERNRDTIGL